MKIEELKTLTEDRDFKKGDIVRHFKNKCYVIEKTVINSETKELMMEYSALYGNYETYVRPLDMFLSEVDKEKYPNEKQKYRFEKVSKFDYCEVDKN